MPEFPKIIILDKEKTKYDWEFYKFLFDDEILVDITVFLLEFIDDDTIKNLSYDNLIDKINNILINNDINFKKNKIFLKNEKEVKYHFLVGEDFIDDERFCRC